MPGKGKVTRHQQEMVQHPSLQHMNGDHRQTSIKKIRTVERNVVRFQVQPVEFLEVAIVKAEAMHDVGDSRTTLMDEQRIEQNRARGDMLEYAIVGSSVAMSLVRRLSRPDAEWLTTQGGKPRGMLSPLSAVTLHLEARKAAHIPWNAEYYAFAHPLDCLGAEMEVMLTTVLGSASRLDDDLFFFLLFGGFVYFDINRRYLAANALSLDPTSSGTLWFDGPYPVSEGAGEAINEKSRLGPARLKQLSRFGWFTAGEQIGGHLLHPKVPYDAGAMVYERTDGLGSRLVFYRVAADEPSHSADDKMVAHLAPGSAKLNKAFERLHRMYFQKMEEAEQLQTHIKAQARGPISKWMRTNFVSIVLYYAIGCLLYWLWERDPLTLCSNATGTCELEPAASSTCLCEPWSPGNTIYFLTTTATTVGFGDYSPQSEEGRLLTAFYAPLGTIAVLGGLLEPVAWILRNVDKALTWLFVWYERRVSYPLDQFWQRRNARLRRGVINPPNDSQKFKLELMCSDEPFEAGPVAAGIHAVLSSAILCLIFVVFTQAVSEEVSFVSSLYYTITTITTIGYGDDDLLPKTWAQKLWTSVFMLFGSSALAVCIGRFRMLLVGRHIYYMDFKLQLSEMMTREAIKERKPEPKIVEDEFVLHVLMKENLVDQQMIDHIKAEFHKIERFGFSKEVGDGEIEMETLFDHLVCSGQILDSNRVDPDSTRGGRKAGNLKHLNAVRHGRTDRKSLGTAIGDLPVTVVDMNTRGSGFDEWMQDVWTPYLNSIPEYRSRVQEGSTRRRLVPARNRNAFMDDEASFVMRRPPPVKARKNSLAGQRSSMNGRGFFGGRRTSKATVPGEGGTSTTTRRGAPAAARARMAAWKKPAAPAAAGSSTGVRPSSSGTTALFSCDLEAGRTRI